MEFEDDIWYGYAYPKPYAGEDAVSGVDVAYDGAEYWEYG